MKNLRVGQVWLAKPNRPVDEPFLFEIVGRMDLPSGTRWIGAKHADEIDEADLLERFDAHVTLFDEHGVSVESWLSFVPALFWTLIEEADVEPCYGAGAG